MKIFENTALCALKAKIGILTETLNQKRCLWFQQVGAPINPAHETNSLFLYGTLYNWLFTICGP